MSSVGPLRFLRHPLMRGRDIDDPATTDVARRILDENRFLRRVYADWYASLRACLPANPGRILELGSGAGFLEAYLPGVIKSDLLPLPGLSVVLDAEWLPFQHGELGAIIMNEVLHHIPDVRRFFTEAARCVRPGGVIALNEPWVSPWSRLVYGKLHHEPFEPESPRWGAPEGGPLSGANSALPWIIFVRDRRDFETLFPCWRITLIRPWMPFRYLVSGGLTYRPLMPVWAHHVWKWLEGVLQPWIRHLAMFAVIRLERTDRIPRPMSDQGSDG